MTRDADLSTIGVSNDEGEVAAIVGRIAAATLALDDGLTFDATTITTEVMREDAEYHGARVKLVVHLATARMTTTLDFSFGDPQRSTVIELPEPTGNGNDPPGFLPARDDARGEDRHDDEPRGAQHSRP